MVSLSFANGTLNSGYTPTVEIWFPIAGHMSYERKISGGLLATMLGEIVDLGDIRNSPPPMIRDYKLKPGANAQSDFFCPIDPVGYEAMKEITDREGVIPLRLRLNFSVLYNVGNIGQKTLKLEPIFNFNVSKAQIERWISTWSASFATFEDLPRSVPKQVINDYFECVKSFNVGAHRATVAMARRALQEALETKGASKGSDLMNQITELNKIGVIDKATLSLAHGVRQFGNYGAHPSSDLLENVTSDDAKLVVDVLKRILKVLYAKSS